MKLPTLFTSRARMPGDTSKRKASLAKGKGPAAPAVVSQNGATLPLRKIVGVTSVNTAPSRESVEERPLTHRIRTAGSVQALAVDEDILIAGLEGGDLVAWSLETFEQLVSVQAHEDSVLGLSLSEDRTLLFSCGADSIVNVWSMHTFEQLYSIYSPFEIGDVFCIAHSQKTTTLFSGSQNTAIQWVRLDGDKIKSSASALAPSNLKHRFFDSLGPGGAVTAPPKVETSSDHSKPSNGRTMRFPKTNYESYAHRSYVYCMLLAKGPFQHNFQEEILITGGGDGVIKLWSLDQLEDEGVSELAKFENDGFGVLSLAFSGLFLYAGLSDGMAHVYNLASRQLVQKLEVGPGDVSSIQVLDGMTFCGTSQGWVKKFDTQFAEVEKWQSNDGKILATGILRSPHRDLILTGGNDNSIAVWNVTERDCITLNTPHSNDDLVESLREFVSYRTVAGNPKYVTVCHEAVSFLQKQFSRFHATTDLLSTEYGMNPILLAKFQASSGRKSNKQESAKTLLFYGHYDVVDAEYTPNDVKWLTDPFKLNPQNGYLYGRGVTDNKGPILAALYAVAELVQMKQLSCNVIFVLEGEEEAGSRSFKETVRANHKKIGNVDYVLLSNSYWLDDHIPCLTYGMRGVIHATITVSSNKVDQHSGMDGKASQHEPLKDLTFLLASLSGASATDIQIPGFQEAVKQKRNNDWEEQQYEYIATTLARGHPEISNKKNFIRSLEERWQEPNLTIHRIEVPESKTAVTISRSAKATLSIRIVPFQTANAVASTLTDYLETEFFKLGGQNELEVKITAKADPWMGKPDREPFTVLKKAVAEVWHPEHDLETRSFPQQQPISTSPQQKRPSHRRASSLASHGTFPMNNFPSTPLFIREGGSIPAIAFLEKEFNATAAMFPMGQASDNAHLDNERMRLENLYKGRDVLKKVFAEL